ncbi:hypothetical protein ACF0H5_013195 [Mactra antiquata]
MSLVAYGSSDDSDHSDEEEGQSSVINVPDVKKSEKKTDLNSKSLDEKFSDSDSEDVIPHSEMSSRSESFLKGLPAPKPVVTGDIEESDVLEDEVKPKPSQIADIEKPPAKKSCQPVKITIPALPDSDEEDGPPKKKPRTMAGVGKSGLTSMLPAPVHAAKKETGRILLPYSLTKKSQSSTANIPTTSLTLKSNTNSDTRNKPKTVTSRLTNYGSDSDDDETESGVNFFSIGGETSSSVTNSNVSFSSSSMNSFPKQEVIVGPALPKADNDMKGPEIGPTVPLLSNTRSSMKLPAPSRDNMNPDFNQLIGKSSDISETVQLSFDADAPLTFKGGVTSKRAYPSRQNSTGSIPGSDVTMYHNLPYDSDIQYPESTDVEGYKLDEEFLRLQGKNQRGKEEINLIDVNADDYTDPSEITKHMTEESSYQPHRKKDNQPSSQQKRKHQIHYLAFQAKERELELKNQWSQNRQTKKQTQAKYGF